MEAMWTSRMRWRLRGAWMWPAFVGFTVLDGILIHVQPIAGDGTAIVPAFLLAGFFNLVAIAVVAKMVGWVVRRRWRPDLPRTVAQDYAGTALLVLVAAGVFAAGLANRGSADASKADFSAQSMAVRRWAASEAPPAYRRNIERADTLKLDTDLYRTCLPGPDPARDLCVYVNTDQHPAGIRRDPSREPNETFARGDQYTP